MSIKELQKIHRDRRYAMKVQQKIDRALESYVRRYWTEWSPELPTVEREKFNAETKRLIKAAAAQAGKDAVDQEGDPQLVHMVLRTQESRGIWDGVRERAETEMIRLAKELPVHDWIKGIHGAGELGLATIIAETGDLSLYANPQKVWARLGYAPFDGHAGSTWKRESWRSRKLTAEEWTAHPFSGARYALMHTISLWLKNKQWVGALKTDTGEGKPNGKYGEIYAARRAHTAGTHPDWSKQHSHMDGLRIMMKSFLADLWCEWNGKQRITSADQNLRDAQLPVVSQRRPIGDVIPSLSLAAASSSEDADHERSDTQREGVGVAAGQANLDAHVRGARRTKKKSADHAGRDAQIVPVSRRRARTRMTPEKSLPAAAKNGAGRPAHR